MAYDRYGRNYGRPGYGRDYGPQGREERGYGRGDFARPDEYGPGPGRPPRYDYEDRGFFDRFGDEVRSWFGDHEAERRRRYDDFMDRRFDADHMNRRYFPSPHDYDERPDAPRTAYGGFGTEMGCGLTRPSGYSDIRPRDQYAETYAAWRNRQMAEYDRDYDEFRRENQARFDRKFGEWRDRRTRQRMAVGNVKEHQEVVGSDGEHVGTVDCIRGDYIVLTKSDKDAGGHHHSVPSLWIDRVEDDKVKLNLSAEEAQDHWRDIETRRAVFEEDYERGPHLLNRAFSGTYQS